MNIRYVRESDLKTDKRTFTNLNSRYVVLMNKIKEFYSNKKNLEDLTSILYGNSNLSLRVIDYFVTNYAREKEIMYTQPKDNFMVYYSYKSQLKAYSKKQFDPFCRRERILFYIDKYDGIKNKPIRTTVGQLNFFRWAIENKVLDYLYKNTEEIEIEMNKFYKKVKNKKPKVKKETKQNINNLTLTATKKINKHNVTITVKFN